MEALKKTMEKTMEVTIMARINRDKARVDVYIDMLKNKEITFDEVDVRWQEKVRTELSNRKMDYLAEVGGGL